MCNNFITTIFSNHGLENRFKYPFTVLVEFTISCLFIFIRGININWHKKKSPRRGIEPRSGTRQAPILTIKLSRIGDLLKKLQHCDIMLFRICQMIYQHTFDYVANSNRLCVHIIYIVICNEHFLTSSSNYK